MQKDNQTPLKLIMDDKKKKKTQEKDTENNSYCVPVKQEVT